MLTGGFETTYTQRHSVLVCFHVIEAEMLMIVRVTEMGKWQHFCRVRRTSGNRGLLRSKKKPVPKLELFAAFFETLKSL